MRGNFWVNSRNPMLISFRDYPPRSAFSKNPQAEIPEALLAPSQRFMITFAFFLQGLDLGIAQIVANPSLRNPREQILAQILVLPKGTKFLVLAPLIRGQKGEYKDLFEDLQRKGFVRARADKKVFRLGEDIKLDRKIKHDIEVVIDRLKIDDDLRSRLAEAVEQALQQSKGSLIVAIEKEDGTYDDILLSSHYACLQCNKSVEPPSPQLFSFNSPHGMCMQCDGLGISYSFDPDLMVPDPSLSF